MDVRTIGGVGVATGSWVRNVNGATTVNVPAPQEAGRAVQLHFSSNLFSPDRNISYRWRSN